MVSQAILMVSVTWMDGAKAIGGLIRKLAWTPTS